MSILVFDLWHGVSGDMILGALADLGLDTSAWSLLLRDSGLPPCDIHFSRVDRAGIQAMKAHIPLEAHPVERKYVELDGLLAGANIPVPAKDAARSVLRRLGETEAGLHGLPLDQVRFHELGALDTLIDIAGACLGMHMLGVREIYTTAFPLGRGLVRMAHGQWREPVPATLNLIRGQKVRFTDATGELCTPTGAALVSTLAKPLPRHLEGKLLSSGYGAGSRNPPDRPNVLRLCHLEPSENTAFHLGHDSAEACEITCNLDNMTPEHLAYLSQALFEAGAVDVWQQSIAMKKGRLGVAMGIVCAPNDMAAVGSVLAKESLTGGYRFHRVIRHVGLKQAMELTTQNGALAAKSVDFGGQQRILPEADAVAAMAKAQGKSWFEIYRSALGATARQGGE